MRARHGEARYDAADPRSARCTELSWQRAPDAAFSARRLFMSIVGMHGNSTRPTQRLTAVSLFSGGGIGDLALRAAGADILVACELVQGRADVMQFNFPRTKVIQGDIAENVERLDREARGALGGRRLDVMFVTPPCQGMSKNGRGKLLQGVRTGSRPKLDPRNRLILHAVELATRLRPRVIVFENVVEMLDTLIEDDGQCVSVLDAVSRRLAPGYDGYWQSIEFADLGVPERRKRLILVFIADAALGRLAAAGVNLFPAATHSKEPTFLTQKWVSVAEALRGVPALDARTRASAVSSIPYHRVPVLDEKKYFWVSNVPPGSAKGAFDNQCVNPKCGYQGNPVHGAERNRKGINRAKRSTPVRCEKCGELLPRPWVVDKVTGEYRIMAGFTSAYKRMAGNLPASALTTNLSYACSDQKLHPTQNRTLSIYEACILHTISDYEFAWKRASGAKVGDQLVRDIIGESIPPRGLEIIFRHLFGLLAAANADADNPRAQAQAVAARAAVG
jgi:DNA (cytosine-5)-methyltransferase 1